MTAYLYLDSVSRSGGSRSPLLELPRLDHPLDVCDDASAASELVGWRSPPSPPRPGRTPHPPRPPPPAPAAAGARLSVGELLGPTLTSARSKTVFV